MDILPNGIPELREAVARDLENVTKPMLNYKYNRRSGGKPTMFFAVLYLVKKVPK